MIKTCFIIFCLIFSNFLLSQEKNKVDIKNADFTYVNNEKHPDYWRLVGNVNIYHNETDMFCDSAYYFSTQEKIIAFNNIKITNNDNINLFGNKLNYDGEKGIAIISENVVFDTENKKLKTKKLKYNIVDDIIQYENRSEIIKEDESIISNQGTYFLNEKKYQFLDSVIYYSTDFSIVTNNLVSLENENYTQLIGPSLIYIDDKTIFCEEGFIYENTAEFFKNAYINSKDFKIESDSIFYNKELEKINALGNVVLIDTLNDILIKSEKADFFEKSNKMIFKKEPELNLISEEDTLIILADRFESFKNEDKSIIYAYPNVKFKNQNLVGRCDSLFYSVDDSLITLFEKPILWFDEYQVFSDTVSIKYFDKKIDKLFLESKPMIISKHDSLEFNQIKGKKMIGNFNKNKLLNIDVIGNGQSIYYLNENEKTVAMNYIESSEIKLIFKNKKIDNVNYEVIPKSITTPIQKINEDKKFLKDFSWRISEKPE